MVTDVTRLNFISTIAHDFVWQHFTSSLEHSLILKKEFKEKTSITKSIYVL